MDIYIYIYLGVSKPAATRLKNNRTIHSIGKYIFLIKKYIIVRDRNVRNLGLVD